MVSYWLGGRHWGLAIGFPHRPFALEHSQLFSPLPTIPVVNIILLLIYYTPLLIVDTPLVPHSCHTANASARDVTLCFFESPPFSWSENILCLLPGTGVGLLDLVLERVWGGLIPGTISVPGTGVLLREWVYAAGPEEGWEDEEATSWDGFESTCWTNPRAELRISVD